MDNELLIAIEELLDRKLDEKLGRIDVRMDRFEERMDRFEERADRFEERMDRFEERMDRFEERMDRFEERMDRFEERMDGLGDRMDKLDTNVQNLNEKVSSMDVRLQCVEITLENDIRPSIMRIAEGHFDLNRKLDKVLESDKEREMLSLRVNYLDACTEIKGTAGGYCLKERIVCIMCHGYLYYDNHGTFKQMVI